MGARLLIKDNIGLDIVQGKCNRIKMFFSSFVVGITNPATILTFVFAFSWFGITADINTKNGIYLVTGVFVGTALWWFVVASIGTLLKNKIDKNLIIKTNKGFATTITIFGLVVFIRTFIN